MANILVNLENQKGAGPKNISRQFLLQVTKYDDYFFILNADQAIEAATNNLTFVVYKELPGFLSRVIYYFYFYYLFLPRHIKRNKIAKYLVFGNYLHGLFNCPARVLIHHPYLFDLRAILAARISIIVKELTKYIVFRALIIFRSNTCLVVQSNSMLFKLKKSVLRRFSASIIPNPFSSSLKVRERNFDEIYPNRQLKNLNNEKLMLAYISRYYPHKRFDSLMTFIEEFRQFNIPFMVMVTVAPDYELAIPKLIDYPEIINCGEVAQEQLQSVYEKIDLCLYFSERETFGNTILESLMFGIPIFGLDYDYFLDFIPDANSPLVSKSVVDMAKSVSDVATDKKAFVGLIASSKVYSEPFKTVEPWVNEMSQFE